MRPPPGPTNIENISKKISSGISALNRVRPFINTHSATKIHQALTLNDTRNRGQFHFEVVQKQQRNTYDSHAIVGNFTSKSSKNSREIHMIPTHSCSFAYKTYYFLFFTFVCFCFCVVVVFCYCCCCFLRSCCCRVVGSRSESENVAKKWIYVLPVFIAVITISKVGVQKTI